MGFAVNFKVETGFQIVKDHEECKGREDKYPNKGLVSRKQGSSVWGMVDQF